MSFLFSSSSRRSKSSKTRNEYNVLRNLKKIFEDIDGEKSNTKDAEYIKNLNMYNNRIEGYRKDYIYGKANITELYSNICLLNKQKAESTFNKPLNNFIHDKLMDKPYYNFFNCDFGMGGKSKKNRSNKKRKHTRRKKV